MKFHFLIDKALASVSNRINKKTMQKLGELSNNNVARSSFAITETFNIITNEIKHELLELINSLSKTNMTYSHIKILRLKLDSFISSEYRNHRNYLIKINIYGIGGIDYSEYIQNEMDDVNATLEIRIQIIEQEYKDKLRNTFWDIAKILLSAIVGGIIGAYIKQWVP